MILLNLNFYLKFFSKLEDFLNTSSFRKLAKRALSKESKKTIELNKISEGKIIHYGHLLIKRLWDRLRFDEFFGSLCNQKRFRVSDAVFYMTARDMILSDSKLGMYESRGVICPRFWERYKYEKIVNKNHAPKYWNNIFTHHA